MEQEQPPGSGPESGSAAQWAAVQEIVDYLDNNAGAGDQRFLRTAKVAEESGEVIAALIGVTGQNPRKGTTHSEVDVAKELVDVAVTAMAALPGWVKDPAAFFDARLHELVERLKQSGRGASVGVLQGGVE